MRKRILATLLSVIMIIGLFPLTVFAATCNATIRFKVIPVYLDDSMYLGYAVDYDSAWEGTLPCTYSTTHSANANHQIAIKGFHPQTINLQVREGYEWVGWEKYSIDLDGVKNPQFEKYFNFSSATTNVTGTGTHYIYMVYHLETPTQPTAPSDSELKGLLENNAVTVDCINEQVNHGGNDSITYGLLSGSYTTGTVTGSSSSGYTYTITVNPEKYVEAYNTTNPGHTLDSSSPDTGTITLKWNGSAWKVDSGAPVTFKVTCPTPPTVDEDWDNVYLRVNLNERDKTPPLIVGYDVSSSVYQSNYPNTVSHTNPVYDPESGKWTMDVTVVGYSASDSGDGHIVNDYLSQTKYKNYELSGPSEQTVTLTYFERESSKDAGWYGSDHEKSIVDFYIAPKTPTPSDPAITHFAKELVTSEPSDVELNIPEGVTVTYPTSRSVTIPADGSVTLLYKLTVTGKAGASFTITDDSATLVGSDCSATQNGNVITGTIPTGQTAATIYVIKTFTADDIENGEVTNTANIASDGGVADDKDTATETTPAEEGKPSAPGEDDLPADLKTGAVKVNCTNTDVNHPDAIYGLIMGGYTSNVAGTAADGWEYTITIDTDAYAAHYDSQKGYAEDTHTATTAPAPTITLTWNKTEKAWELKQGTTLPVTVKAKCTTPVVPGFDITGFTKSLVIAGNEPSQGVPNYVTIPNRGETVVIPANGTVTLLYKLTVTGKAGVSFTVTDEGAKLGIYDDCDATLNGNEITGTIPTSGTATIYVTKTFTASDIKDGYVINTASIAANNNGTVDPEIEDPEVKTPAEEGKPGAPDEETIKNLLNSRIKVDCITTDDEVHPSGTYGWMEGGCTLPADVTYNHATDTWEYVITINADVYVNYYDTAKLNLPAGTHVQTGNNYTITLTWGGQGWSCNERVDIEATCSLYTLTYDANGGTFGNGTEFKVDNIVLNTLYELGKESNYAEPTKGTDVFLGWTTDKTAENRVYGAGDKLPDVVDKVTVAGPTTVYAVWSEDTNGDGIADAQQIVITPADITVYTGGDSYAGVVDGNGNLVGNSSGIPEPGYYFTLPYELNEYLRDLTGAEESQPVNLAQYIRLDDTSDDQREWVLALYDGELTSIANGKYIYRMVKEGNGPAKLEIRDDQGNIVTNDKFEISNAALYQEYAMSLDDSAVDNGKIAVQVKVSGDWKDLSDITVIDTKDMELGLAEGTLTVRGTDTSTPTVTTDVVTDADAISEANADIVAVAGEDVNYTINGSTVNTDGQIGLYTDGLLPNTVLDTYLKNKGLTDANTQVDYQYLDLVDTNNGNAYVTTNKDLDIYWKLPADADASGDFYVVHFNGLDRNYDVTDLENLVNAYGVTVYSKANNNLEVVTIGGEQYLKFATSTFSPFALVYDTQVEEPVPETVTVAFESGKHGDFGQYHVTGAYVEVVKGERLNRADIPTVYEDTDYEFIGWYKQGSNSWYLYSDAQLLKMTFDSDATFIAQYKHVGDSSVDDEYDVVYNANFTDGGVPRRQGYDKGETVTVSENKWFERDGYIFVGWNTEADGTGDSYDPDDTFKMPGRDVYLYAQWQKEKPGPDDTGVSRWLETENHNAYLTGYPDSTFGADRNMTRAEVAQMFYALLKNKNVMITTSFSDVSNDAWYATAVKTMASLGMMSGYPDGTFRPDEPITRAEFATVALAFAYEPDNARCSYLDVSTSAWYYPYVAQATTYGWIGGYPGGTFRPNNSITRVEVCVIVNNMLGRTPDEDYIDRNEDELVNFVDLSDRYWGYYTIMEATNGHEYTGNYSNETWESAK